MAILAALRQLPELARTVILEHDFEGTEMADIAARHRVPASTAYKHRARGMAALAALVRTIRGAPIGEPNLVRKPR